MYEYYNDIHYVTRNYCWMRFVDREIVRILRKLEKEQPRNKIRVNRYRPKHILEN